MFGGLARHETITPDGLALVACHEIGHHLGGAPKKTDFDGSLAWAANEGQADYYGTSKCIKRLFEKDDNLGILRNINVDTFAVENCKTQYETEQDVAICERASMAGMSLAQLFKSIRRSDVFPRFDTPDKKFIQETFHGHPAPQCRLDTYFAGALCNKDPYIDFADDLASDTGACSLRDDSFKLALRPNCWFGTNDAI
jgi:hypothetical protein